MKKIALFLALVVSVTGMSFAADTQQSRGKRKKATTTRVEKRTLSTKVNSVVPAWLEGNWKYTTSMMGRRMECRVGINGNIIVVMYNGEMQYTGPFTIEGNQLIYNRKNGTCDYMLIDRANQRIMADETTPLHRF